MKIKTLCAILTGTLLLSACFVPMPETPETPHLNLQVPVAVEEEVIWDANDYQGKPILIATMATWCPWCKRSLAALEETNKNFGEQVEVVGLFIDNDLEKVQKVQKEYNMQTKTLYQGEEAAQELHVEGFPHIMLFDKNHQLVKVWSGYSDTLADEYRNEITKLLK